MVKSFFFKKKHFYLNRNVPVRTVNGSYIYIWLNSFVPFLLDMCDFLWGEAFLHKRGQFPHRLVLLSTAVHVIYIVYSRPRNWAIFGGWAWPKAAQEMLWPARPGPAFANHDRARPGPPNRFCRPARPGPGPTINRERICLYKQIHGKSTYTSSQ
jgi:hypothetical protein